MADKKEKNGGRPASGFYSPHYGAGDPSGHPAADSCMMALLMLPFTLLMRVKKH